MIGILCLFRGLLLATSLRAAAAEFRDGRSDQEQIPLSGDTTSVSPASSSSSSSSSSPLWFHPPLNFSSTAPHLFGAANGLLQQWANTIFPNGHTIAAVVLPAYTLLYHGRLDDDEGPPSPEWLALDVEMAYGIMGGSRASHLLSYQSTRATRLVYFDGESATLMGLGQLDTQMLMLYGGVEASTEAKPKEEKKKEKIRSPLSDEYDRARGLCDWLEGKGLRGRGWGFEGVVRMNAGFEVIWCDFQSDSLRLLSRLDVTVPLGGGDDDDTKMSVATYSLPPVPSRSDRVADPTMAPAPPNWRRPGYGYGGPYPGPGQPGPVEEEEPFLASQAWGWFESATWHYGASGAGPGFGETRLRVDPCAVLSWYAPAFVDGDLGTWRSHADTKHLEDNDLQKLARRRRYHHLANATVEEAAAMRNRTERALEGVLRRANGTMLATTAQCSGADWPLMMAEIVQRTAPHLRSLEHLLEEGMGLVGGGKGTEEKEGKEELEKRDWLRRLRVHNHRFMVSYLTYPDHDDDDAWLPNSALYNHTLSLCRYRYTRLLTDDDNDNNALTPEERDLRWAVEETFGAVCATLLGVGFDVERINKNKNKTATSEQVQTWKARVTELTAWLGWEGALLGCDRVCAWNERCFIPMWPLLGRQWRPGNGTFPWPGRRYPGYGYPDYGYPGYPDYPPGNETHKRPHFGFPRSPLFMGDETDLWKPKCVNESYIMR